MLEKDIENLLTKYPEEFFPKLKLKPVGQQVFPCFSRRSGHQRVPRCALHNARPQNSATSKEGGPVKALKTAKLHIRATAEPETGSVSRKKLQLSRVHV